MKKIQLLTVIAALTAAVGALAQVPSIINYQGRLSVGGTNLFNGTGQFQFALVSAGSNVNWQATATATVSGGFLTVITVTDGGKGYGEIPGVTITDSTGSNAVAVANLTGGVVTSVTVTKPGRNYSASPTVTIAPPPPSFAFVTYWSNDGSSTAGSEPGQPVPVPVVQGLFSVNLGDTSLSNMTAVIAPSIFTNSDVWLRIWFSDGVSAFQQFYPDQRLTAAGYAMTAANVVDGAITASKLAPGAVGVNAVAPNAVGTANIADGSVTSAKLATGAVGSSALAANAVNTTNIVDGAVTTAKLNAGVPLFPNGMAVFTSSGTWTKPAGVSRIHVKLWGGGGGGQGGNSIGGPSTGSGGGAGGYCEGVIIVTDNVSVTVGNGGTVGSSFSGNGGNGGTSSFSSLNANGGTGGASGGGSSGGGASGGSLNVTGQAQHSSSGGNAPLGGGVGGLYTTGTGNNGEFPGGGAAGGAGFAPSAGGSGAPGMVIVYY